MDNMTAADYLKVWKDYVNKLTHLLLALDGSDSSQACQQVCWPLTFAHICIGGYMIAVSPLLA